jgi:hypothetical protein
MPNPTLARMQNFNMDTSNPGHVRAALDEEPWVQKFKQLTGKHPLDLGIDNEQAAQNHLMTIAAMKNMQTGPATDYSNRDMGQGPRPEYVRPTK